MLLEISEADKAEAYVMNALAQKKKTKMSGFGHWVYRTEDLRATHLREMSRRLGERVGNTNWRRSLNPALSETSPRLSQGFSKSSLAFSTRVAPMA